MIDNAIKWFFLILATAWLFVTLAILVVVIFITHDAVATIVSSCMMLPGILIFKLHHYYFPPSPADYEIQKLKLQLKSDRTRNRKRASP